MVSAGHGHAHTGCVGHGGAVPGHHGAASTSSSTSTTDIAKGRKGIKVLRRLLLRNLLASRPLRASVEHGQDVVVGLLLGCLRGLNRLGLAIRRQSHIGKQIELRRGIGGWRRGRGRRRRSRSHRSGSIKAQQVHHGSWRRRCGRRGSRLGGARCRLSDALLPCLDALLGRLRRGPDRRCRLLLAAALLWRRRLLLARTFLLARALLPRVVLLQDAGVEELAPLVLVADEPLALRSRRVHFRLRHAQVRLEDGVDLLVAAVLHGQYLLFLPAVQVHTPDEANVNAQTTMTAGAFEAHKGAHGQRARGTAGGRNDEGGPSRLPFGTVRADHVFGLGHQHLEALLELLLRGHGWTLKMRAVVAVWMDPDRTRTCSLPGK
mmetsp:Transcript_22190/g.63663  ORF Transcript_22190/g.63663 Transcript_22190/m.63663 type:complete len:377 (-) Transcript_22190:473-1603(-)